jgi:cardiolipin synthase
MNPSVQLLANGIEIRRSISEVVAGSRQSLSLMMYMFRSDEAGQSVLTELIAALHRGASVKLILDGFGSLYTPDRFFLPFLEAGGEIKKFNHRWRPQYLLRNHQKFIIADSQTALTGGFNIGDDYFGDGLKTGWREIGVRVDGRPVGDLQRYFNRMWEALAGDRFRLKSWTRIKPRGRVPRTDVEWLVSSPSIGRSEYGRSLRKDLKRSAELSLMMGYFVPTVSLRRMIGRIARRGRAELVLPAITDVPISRLAAWFTFGRLLRDGCNIYEYQPRPLHAKLVVLDDVTYVGSANIDTRSLHLNFEMTLRVRDIALAEQARALIKNDIRLSLPITRDIYERSSSLVQRLMRRIAYTLLSRFDYFVSKKLVD